MFIAIEGADGTGKTTQVERLCRWLEEKGHKVVRCRDPGGTALGEAVRDILLHRQTVPLDTRAEALLYMASRAQLVAEVIRPAVEAGYIVVSDRYLLSNIAYQGYGFGLSVETLRQIGTLRRLVFSPMLQLFWICPSPKPYKESKERRTAWSPVAWSISSGFVTGSAGGNSLRRSRHRSPGRPASG